MGKKILIVTGSPRHQGNTCTIANWVAEGATEHGAEVKMIDAARLQFKTHGCTSCMGCQESDKFHCIIKDEASEVIASIPEYDVLVFATPVYFFSFSAQLKMFIDRMYSLYKFKETEIISPTRKLQFGLIATAGGDYGSGLDVLEKCMAKIAGFSSQKSANLLVPLCPVEVAETMMNAELKERSLNFGASLAK